MVLARPFYEDIQSFTRMLMIAGLVLIIIGGLVVVGWAVVKACIQSGRTGRTWGDYWGRRMVGSSSGSPPPPPILGGPVDRNKNLQQAGILGGAVLVSIVALVILLLMVRQKPAGNFSANPQGNPSSRTPGGDADRPITDADFAYLVFCPKLADEFQLDRMQQLQIAILGRGISTRDAEDIGREVRQLLTRSQGERLEDMLRDGRLKHVTGNGPGSIRFTPFGWDQWEGKAGGPAWPTDFTSALGKHYSKSYVLSLIRGVDDVLPLLGKGAEYGDVAKGWLLRDAKPAEADRGRFCQTLLDKLRTSSPAARPLIALALLQWADKPEAPLLAELFNRREPAAAPDRILQKIVAFDPTLLERLAIASADDALRLSMVILEITRLPEDKAQPMIVRLAAHRDERVRMAAQGMGRQLLASALPASRPGATGPARPPAPTRKPIDNSADALAALGGTDALRRREALRWIAAAKNLDDPRAALAALDGMLESKDQNERREALGAYIRWAGAEQAARLTALANSGADLGTAWPTLVAGLMRLDPATGRKIFEEQYDKVAFRSPTVIELKRLDSSCETSFWPLLESPKWEVVKSTCDILGEIGTKSSLPMLEALVAKAPKQSQATVKRMVDTATAKIKGRGK